MTAINGLPIGTIIHGERYDYEILYHKSQDGFGILYAAKVIGRKGEADPIKPSNQMVMMREFFMNRCSTRDEDGCTVSTPDELAPTVNNFYEAFKYASERCLQATREAGLGIIHVKEVVSQHNTSYYVVEFLGGEPLDEYIKKNGPLSAHEAFKLMKPIFTDLKMLHVFRIMHADIYPRHFRIITEGGEKRMLLYSLYASKHFDDNNQPVITTPILVCRKGYAPPEQYNPIETFIPQLDIYAIAAVMVFMLSGKNLPDSRILTEKEIRETLPPTLPESLTSTLISALDPNITNRPSSIISFSKDLTDYFESDNQDSKSRDRRSYNIDIDTPLGVTPIKNHNFFQRLSLFFRRRH
ncbi:MAG: hypothetical protein NC221_06670 [Duncaniella sp.]|nr:hypothetical protein [Duncaniella sp.]